MAVVLYSGGLARYFLGDWQGPGEAHHSDPAGDSDSGSEEAASPIEVQAYFEAFRDSLIAELKPHLPQDHDLHWQETLTGPQKVVFLSESAFSALMLIAARAAVANKRLNPIAINRPWYEDPAVESLQDEISDFQPVHHLVQADTWLPSDFGMVIPTEVPERDVILGSLTQLSAALTNCERLLYTPNEATRKLAPAFVAEARLGLAAFLDIAAHAREHQLPVLIEALD